MTTNTQPQTQQSGGDELTVFMESLGYRLHSTATGPYWVHPSSPICSINKKTAALFLAALQARERAARIDELTKVQVSLRAFVNGTSTFPAADELLEIADHLQQLKPQAGEGGEG